MKQTPGRGTILIIDDDIKILRSLSAVLERQGFKVIAAATPEQGLAAVGGEEIEAVLLDLVLGASDGTDVLKAIRATKPGLPVIMLTGHGTISKAVASIKLGAFDFLEKPIESEKITISIDNALKKTRLEKERALLLSEVLERYRMIGVSPALQKIFGMIDKAAPTDSRILITGESGTGKELIARAIHLRSPRAGSPFLAVNCAAIPEGLIESELFGHEKGAFTGAVQRREGKFRLASGGTLFLDEIGDMSLMLQAKVLRSIEEGQVHRVGGAEAVLINTRVIAASNRDLKAAVRDGSFREDLFFRLNVIDIHVPPLRERKDDIPVLADLFLKELCAEKKIDAPAVAPAAMEALLSYTWPGNVRELKNFLEKMLVLHPGELLSADIVAGGLKASSLDCAGGSQPQTLSDARKSVERDIIHSKLLSLQWDYEETARELGISRATLFNKLKEYQIKRKN